MPAITIRPSELIAAQRIAALPPPRCIESIAELIARNNQLHAALMDEKIKRMRGQMP